MANILRVDISDSVARRWADLIKDCQRLHHDEIKARIDGAGETGINELIYAPMGPDITRELETFLDVATTR
jgi:hypothetical protein